MKKSKRFAALFATVLMAITMFTGSISAYAATPHHDPKVPNRVSTTGVYGALIITGWHSNNSKTKMYAQTTGNRSTYRLAVTMVARNVDSKGNLKKTGGSPDKSKDLTSESPVANITSGTGNHFTKINIYYAGLIDDNVNHCAYTEYQKTFWQIKY